MQQKPIRIFKIYQKFESNNYIITRPNCALDKHAIQCLYIPGFQREVFKDFPKIRWVPRTNFQQEVLKSAK